MKELRRLLEVNDRLHRISNARVIIDNADTDEQLVLAVSPSQSNNTNRLKDVIDYFKLKCKPSDYKILTEGNDKDPLQVRTDKYTLINLLNTTILNDLEYVVSKYTK